MISLSSLLFEAAPTASEALASGTVGFIEHKKGSYVRVVLVDGEAFEKLLRDNASARNFPEVNPLQYVRGYVWVPKVSDSLFKVSNSAGVDKHGPLAYRVAMDLVTRERCWLRSDDSMTDDAKDVWNKMYELSEEGVYTRKFIGDFGKDAFDKSAGAIKSRFWETIFEKLVKPGKLDEQSFLSLLSETPYTDPDDFGWFWAYQTTFPDPGTNQLIESGKQLQSRLKRAMPANKVVDIANNLGVRFFALRYDGLE